MSKKAHKPTKAGRKFVINARDANLLRSLKKESSYAEQLNAKISEEQKRRQEARRSIEDHLATKRLEEEYAL